MKIAQKVRIYLPKVITLKSICPRSTTADVCLHEKINKPQYDSNGTKFSIDLITCWMFRLVFLGFTGGNKVLSHIAGHPKTCPRLKSLLSLNVSKYPLLKATCLRLTHLPASISINSPDWKFLLCLNWHPVLQPKPRIIIIICQQKMSWTRFSSDMINL